MNPLAKLLAIRKLINQWANDENYDHDSAYLSQIEDIVKDLKSETLERELNSE
jgi:hypothetical protein